MNMDIVSIIMNGIMLCYFWTLNIELELGNF